jgi:hypothetical protein
VVGHHREQRRRDHGGAAVIQFMSQQVDETDRGNADQRDDHSPDGVGLAVAVDHRQQRLNQHGVRAEDGERVGIDRIAGERSRLAGVDHFVAVQPDRVEVDQPQDGTRRHRSEQQKPCLSSG